ncbi:MAG: GAF domain-containing protein, partial [Acidobacteriota bacterium]
MSESQQASKPLSQRQEELDRHVTGQVESLINDLRARLDEQVQAAQQGVLQWLATQGAKLPDSFTSGFDLSTFIQEVEVEVPVSVDAPEESPGEDAEAILQAVAAIDGEIGQAEILSALLDQATRFASSAAFLLIRSGQVRSWASRGLGDGHAASLSEEASASPWSEMIGAHSAVILGAESSAEVSARLGGAAMDGSVLVPFAIRGQISGALWAGRATGDAISVPALQLLVHAAAMALETASVSPGRSPALDLEGSMPEDPDAALPEGLPDGPAEQESPEAPEVAAEEADQEARTHGAQHDDEPAASGALEAPPQAAAFVGALPTDEVADSAPQADEEPSAPAAEAAEAGADEPQDVA